MEQTQNIDQRDVDHFSSYADIWWDKNGTWKALHSLNEVRIPFIINAVKARGLISSEGENLNGLKVLDVGCGAGIVSEVLAEKGGDVVGLDASEELIKAAENHSKLKNNLNLKYVHGLIEDHAEKYSNSYDVLVASEIIEHIIDKDSFLNACVKCVKPGGSIIITTLNRTFLSWYCAKLWGEYILRILPIGTHQWGQFMTPEEMTIKMDKIDCENFESIGWFYAFWNGTFWNVKNMSVNYAIHFIKKK